MSRALVALATVLGLLVGGGVAWAAWTSSGPGSATARANTLGTPTATASAWTCGTTPSGFAASGRGVESFGEQVVTTTPATPRAATTTTTTAAPPPATTTTTTPSVTTAAPTSTSSAAPTTTTTVSPTTSTSGAVSGLGAAAATLRWSAVPGAAAYQFQAAPTADFAVPSTGGTTSGLSSTVTVRALLVRVTVYLRVRAVSGAWSGPWSPTLTTTAGPCLAG